MRKHAQRATLDQVSPDLSYEETASSTLNQARESEGTAFSTLSESEETLISGQSMEAMGRLAGGMAHIFTNLLTAIACEAELALLRLSPDNPARKYMFELERVNERGAEFTRQLLAISGCQVLQPKLVQLNKLLNDFCFEFRRVLGDRIDLRMDLDPNLDCVIVDPEQIQQAVLNLISNARDVMVAGGQVTLATRTIEVRPGNRTHPMRLMPGRYVELQVADTGPGMADNVLRRVFEPFFSTKRGTEIAGLGLSISYGIVMQSGGHLTADSEPGQGANFRIFLPSVEDLSQATQSADSKLAWETILFVENEESIRRPISEILKSRGYNVLEAADAAQAQEIGRRYPGPIHLMVTDTLMEGMSGIELAEQLSYDRAGMKVLFTTGYPSSLPEEIVLGGNFLQKPFNGRELTTKMREVIEALDGLEANEVIRSGLSPAHLETGSLSAPPSIESDVDAIAGERSQLLALKHSRQNLTSNQQERLESLTARLKELLPPISVSELETLFEMMEEVERTRKRARERRHRLEVS